MKKFLTLKNILVCVGALFGILVFALSFADGMKGVMDGADARIPNIVWGSTKLFITYGGQTETFAFYDGFGVANSGILALPFIGVLLALLSAIGACVVLFIVKDAKVQKIALLVCGGLLLLGGVFQFFAGAMFPGHVANKMIANGVIPESNRELVYRMFANMHANAAVYLTGVFGVLGGAAIAVSQFLPEKK